ncbi:MAG: DbpA RNA binding domain-containing protein, partial [Thermoleophilia bacterium]|nr:DbpA RNA binding domain-containing protein [Thermoleophilia bacterium]
QAVEAEADAQADDGAEAIAVETAVESGLTGDAAVGVPEAVAAADQPPEPVADDQVDETDRPAELRRPRHIKPAQENVNDDGEYSLLIVGAGAAAGVEPADVIELIRSSAGLSGQEVRRVRVLARFTLVRVPVEKATDVAKAIDGGSLRGQQVRAEAATGTS